MARGKDAAAVKTKWEHEKREAAKSSNHEKLAKACFGLGEWYFGEDLFDLSIKEFKQFIDENGNLEHEDLELAYRRLGEAYKFKKKYNRAIDFANKYVELAEKLDHKIEIQRALATLGSIYLEQTLDLKETDRDGYNEAGRQAKSHLLKSIDAIPSKRDNCCTSREAADMKVAANTNLYMLEAYVTCMENGHSYYKEAERIGEEHDLHHSLFALYDFAMKLYLGKNDFVAAKAHIVSSLSSLKHLEGSHDFNILNTETTCYRAKIAIGLDDFSGAKKLLSKRKDKKDEFALACRLTKITKKINRNPDNQIIKCMLYDELGDIMMDEFDYKDNALRYYDKAFNACPVTDVRRKSRLLFSMGEIKRELKQWDEAVKYYTIDVQLCKEDNPGYAVHSAIWRAVCLAKLEQPKQSVLENFDIALKMSQRAKCRNQEKHVLDILLEYLKDYDNLKADEIEVKLQQYRDVKDVDSEPDDDVEKQRLLETLDDSTDSEEELTQFSSISKHCKYRIKVNSKGETELQLKCKDANNLEIIKKLINDGHPVNFRDKCGYVPLHDAVMADQLDYVKVLRQNHANIDIQSTDFKKVTALMDACSNGFVDIIEYLLEAGADVNLRDKAGWSAADHFKNYVQEYENEHWSDEDKSKARHWIKKLALLETNTKIIKEERSVYQAERGLPEDVDSIFIQPDINEIKSNVKCRPRNEQPASRAPSLSSDRRSPPAQKKSRLALKRKRIDDTFPRIAAEKKSLSESQRLEVFSKKSKFFDHVVDAPIEEPRELVAVSSTTLPSSTPSILRGTSMSYTVRVHDKLLLVPTPSSATVKDLADETARRYLESHGRKPFLRLTTVDGAELHPGDKLEAIFDARSSVSHRIESIVDQWNTGPIDETYERLCTKTGEMQFTDCKAKLVGAVTQGLLSMDRCGLVCPSALNPVLKASEDQASIRQIHVPNCRIAIRISLFCKTVSTLSNLTVLNLANNGLSATNLHDLQKISPNLGRVRVLDLSFNFLGDECSTTMAKILANLTELTTLSIKSCHLTSQFFRRRKEDFKQSLKGLSDVDVSYNRLGSIGVVDFLTCLDVTLVRSINLSGCVMYASDDKKLADTLESFLNDSAVLGYVGFRRNAIDLTKFPSHLQRFLKCGH